jgi:hypothetical protein
MALMNAAVCSLFMVVGLPLAMSGLGGPDSSSSLAGARQPALLADPKADPKPDPKVDPTVRVQPRVQIALLLDTSNSMDGLIGQARAQLWNIVCDLAKSKRNGVPPRLEVALYEYGNDSLSKDGEYVRRVLPLTDDLDAISEKLFALTTNGGQEYCGAVIRDATKSLEWSRDARDLRMIVVAGNEPFTQGPVDFRSSVPAAASAGIVVNTIHCGPEGDGIEGGWKLGATLGGGCFSFIDSNVKPRHCPSPYDDQIGKLGAELNGTYVPFGLEGKEKSARQDSQDRLAEAATPGAAVQRAAAKSTALYNNAGWDLVDAVRDGKRKVEDVREEELPEAMRKMSPKDRVEYVRTQSTRRVEIQTEITTLEAKRQQFINEQMKQDAAQPQTWGEALLNAIRLQAKERGLVKD